MKLPNLISRLFKMRSVYFITMHKCASTLFSNFALGRIKGLEHVDYMASIYEGSTGPFPFHKRGFVYGPLRLTHRSNMPEYQKIMERVATSEYLRRRNVIFFVRDPRDILVSQYHSFGFTHGFSSVPEVRALQEKHRAKIRGMTIDEYALWFAPRLKKTFSLISSLHADCVRGSLLRYEDMVGDWDKFVSELTRNVEMSPEDLEELRKRSRPREKVENGSHRRDGSPGQFRSALRPETVSKLNEILAENLIEFGYAV